MSLSGPLVEIDGVELLAQLSEVVDVDKGCGAGQKLFDLAADAAD